MGLELTTDMYPPITSQKRYPLRHATSCVAMCIDDLPTDDASGTPQSYSYGCSTQPMSNVKQESSLSSMYI